MYIDGKGRKFVCTCLLSDLVQPASPWDLLLRLEPPRSWHDALGSHPHCWQKHKRKQKLWWNCKGHHWTTQVLATHTIVVRSIILCSVLVFSWNVLTIKSPNSRICVNMCLNIWLKCIPEPFRTNKHFHTQNKLTWDLVEMAWHAMMPPCSLSARCARQRWIAWPGYANNHCFWLTEYLPKSTTSPPHTRRNSSVISGKTDAGELVQATEKQKNTISLVISLNATEL